MKRKALIVGALLALLCVGFMQDANAHGRGYRRVYGYPYPPHPVLVVPAPPLVVAAPRYRHHYRPHPHYVRARHHHGYYAKPYAYRGPRRHW